MNDKKFHEVLEEVLKKNQKYVNQDGSLNRNEVVNDALKYSEVLLEYLYSNITLRDEFFMKLKDVLVFKQSNFIDFIEDKMLLAGSYTKYKNKIGLSVGNSYLKKNQEVVLSFPFKDCVLEGGQIKGEDKKQEKFYNEILAIDEIDRLLDPKVISNAKRIGVNGEEELKSFNKDESGNIKDNLLIKGNNLLALHSLKEKFAGKIKLIYIDPPYNTGNDEFKYNDNFNHSTWLVFMKNRLQIAKELLREDGVIFVQIDDNEQAYLKILMDEIFGRDKFVNEIIWKRKFGNANETKRLGTAYDSIYLFAKSDNYEINLIREKNSKHVQEYIRNRFTRKDEKGIHKDKLWMPYPLANPGKPTKNLIYEYKGYNPPEKGWRMTQEKLEKLDQADRLYFPEDKKQRIQEKKFLDEYDGQPVDSLWTDIFVINSQSTEAFNFDGQKPEALLERIIKIATKENDIVLDFFAGSGTTGAVAHKMNRQWIMVEQMDYIESITKVRLQKVIGSKKANSTNLLNEEELEFDNGGISKALNWQGGGDFVYLELKKSNQNYIDKINNANNSNELITIKHEILEKAFIDYNIHINNLKKDDNEDFNNLSLENQKKLLIEILDKNQLYVNYSEREDTMFNCTKEEIKLSEDFNK